MIEANNIVQAIQNAERIVITSHRSPDGDSIGSSLGLLRFIKALGKTADVCHPDPCPDFIEWTKKGDIIIDFEGSQELVTQKLNDADLIFSLDYNATHRLGNDMGDVLAASSAKKIMIDHHLDPDDYADITVSEPSISSTAELIYELIDASGNKGLLHSEMAEPIYLGIMTDTGSFRYSSVTARTHEVAAELIKSGLDHTVVHESTFDGNRIDKLKLRGYAIAEKLEVVTEYGVAILSLTEAELEKFNYIKGDTEGLVNIALSVQGVKTAVFFVESKGRVKISFRSKGLPVNVLANENFDGGGHKFAAGGISDLSMTDTLEKFRSLLPKYFSE
jgi:phosphoesterase RecJ-like protein